mmetsp:Transcript_27799/g.66982  ORF Transcript_27799/g.66982 Transcript_27799/m.66982 type:complete len:247 (-) Transcript_27799:1443-2183(-)
MFFGNFFVRLCCCCSCFCSGTNRPSTLCKSVYTFVCLCAAACWRSCGGSEGGGTAIDCGSPGAGAATPMVVWSAIASARVNTSVAGSFCVAAAPPGAAAMVPQVRVFIVGVEGGDTTNSPLLSMEVIRCITLCAWVVFGLSEHESAHDNIMLDVLVQHCAAKSPMDSMTCANEPSVADERFSLLLALFGAEEAFTGGAATNAGTLGATASITFLMDTLGVSLVCVAISFDGTLSILSPDDTVRTIG